MARDEAKQRRDEARGGRRASAEAGTDAPLVSAKRGKFRTVENAKIEALVFARLEDYKAFVAEIEGEEPEAGAVISAGLELLFDADRGFERWLAEQRRKGRHDAPVVTSGGGAKGGAASAVTGAGA